MTRLPLPFAAPLRTGCGRVNGRVGPQKKRVNIWYGRLDGLNLPQGGCFLRGGMSRRSPLKLKDVARTTLLTLGTISLGLVTVSAQTFSVLHAFTNPANGTNQDGANPMTGLSSLGNVLCGTTVNGGRFRAGTIFYLDANGSDFNPFRAFTNSPDAGKPEADVVVLGNSFYGTSFGGGAHGTGTVFTGQTNGTGPPVYSFAALNADTATNALGGSPSAPIVLAGSTFYGTATAGGAYGNGVVFSGFTNNSSVLALHTFTAIDPVTGTNLDGATPWGGLVLSGDTLYGTTSAGGAGGNGTVYSLNTNGSGFNTLYSFGAMDPVTGTNTDGAVPMNSLVLSNGKLYGTASVGGFGDSGTIFSVLTNGSEFSALHHFTSVDFITRTNSDGANPQAALVLSGSTLYGTTPAGGVGAAGTIFSIRTNGSQFKSLYQFTAASPATGTNSDGAFPVAALLQSGSSLYGTTFGGGPGAAGTVFRFTLPTAPAAITSIVRNSDGSVTLSFLGAANSTNIVQATTNLAAFATWRNVSTNVADAGGSWQCTDTATSPFPLQFYRSHSP